MTPEQAITALDSQLAEHGEGVTLKRTGLADVTCRALVRGIKASELIGTATVLDLKVVVSSTGFGTFGLPQPTDFVVLKGKRRQVKYVDPIYLNDIWVRCNMVVGG